MADRELWQLQQMQGLPLNMKIALTKERIRQWVNHYGTDGVYVSFSGGKDSTVLVDIVRNEMGYKEIPLVFVDVPTQYPELKTFVQGYDGVEIVKPEMNFFQVCEKYGFPLISKEVAETVYGARKYLTRLLEENSLDRQTDRQTDLPYKYYYKRITGTGEYAKFSDALQVGDSQSIIDFTRGYDRKYRKLRGIGEFDATKENEQGWEQQTISFDVGNVGQTQQHTSKGHYP